MPKYRVRVFLSNEFLVIIFSNIVKFNKNKMFFVENKYFLL